MSLADELAAEMFTSPAEPTPSGGGSIADELAAEMFADPDAGRDTGAFVGEFLSEPLSAAERGSLALRSSAREWADHGGAARSFLLGGERPESKPGIPLENVLDRPEMRSWYEGHAEDAGVQQGEPSLWTPEDTDNLATYGPPAAALATGMALPALGAWGTLAAGVGLGAAARGGTAAIRGEDVSDAVLDPGSIALDAGLSGIPLAAQGVRAGFGMLPKSVQAPVSGGIGRIREAGQRALDRAADVFARGTPRYGATLIDEAAEPRTLANILDRPPLPEIDLSAVQTTPINQHPTPRSPLRKLWEGTWQAPTRSLLASDDPIAKIGGQMLQRARQLDDSMAAILPRKVGSALEAVPAEQGDDVVKLLEGDAWMGAATPEAQGGKRAVRGLLDEINQLREGRVYDQVRTGRALELVDEGVPVHAASNREMFAPAQRTEFFFPRMQATDPTTQGLSGVERAMASGASAEQAMRRLHSTARGKAVGFSRTTEPMTDYSRDLNDVLPRYANREGTRIVNAEVFGGKPVKLAIETPHGVEDMLVGEKGAIVYKHLLNRGLHDDARQFGMALVDRYGGKLAGENDAARWAARTGSDMALGHTALTQVGQAGTPIWAAGGPRQWARGRAMVNANPALKQIFEAGPSRTSFVDYATIGREDVLGKTTGLSTPMEAMQGIESWLRGPQSYSAVAMIDDVAQEAKAVRDAGGTFSAALTKRAAEMGTTPDALADELMRNGTLSPERWLESIQSLVNRWQYTVGPGDIGHMLRTPTGALLAQYKSFGIKASQHLLDDVLAPLASADPSLRALGRQRLRDLLIYGGGSNALASATKALARGRAPALANMGQAALTGTTGIAGDTAGSVVDAFSPEYGEHPLGELLQVPALQIPARAVERTLGGIGTGDPLRAAEGASTLLGAYDPRIPMYSAPFLGAARTMTRETR